MTKVSQNGLITRSIAFLFRRRGSERKNQLARNGRKLRLETLEDRMLLAILPPTGSADANALIAQQFCNVDMEPVSSRILVTTLEDKVDQTDGLISLREAIGYVGSGSTVLFGQSGTIALTSTIVLNQNITFDASASGTITLDARWSKRIMEVSSSSGKIEITINNFRFMNGNANEGGALRVESNATVNLNECYFTNNLATGTRGGGAVYVMGTLCADQTVWTQNSASRGGAISVGSSGILGELKACTLNGNSATEAGGGLYVANTQSVEQVAYVTNTIFEANSLSSTTTSSEFGGGACMIVAGIVEFNDCDFWDNKAKERDGGAIFCGSSYPVLSIFNSCFEGNSASSGAGVSLSSSTDAQFDKVMFIENIATMQGGGLYNNGFCDVKNCSFQTNGVLQDDGGGIYNDGGQMIISGSTVWNNTCGESAGSGAGITNKGKMFILDTLISDNKAGVIGSGGGIRNLPNGVINMINSTVANNVAYSSGGGIENEGTITLVSSIVANNQVTGQSGDGGGLYLEGNSSATITNSTIYGNSAARNGGGIYTKGSIGFTTSTVTANQDKNLNVISSGLYKEPESSGSVTYDNESATLYDNVTTNVPKDESVSLVLCDSDGYVLEGVIDFAVFASDSETYRETFQIWNRGLSEVTLNPSVTGINVSSFQCDFNSPSMTIDPGEKISLTVSFTPNAPGVSVLNLNSIAGGKSQWNLLVAGTVAPALGTVSEKSFNLSAVGGSTSYTVVLDEYPGDDVIVELVVPQGLYSDKSFLTFTSDNWNHAQTVTLTSDQVYLSENHVDTLTVYHRIVPSDKVFDATFDPAESIYNWKISDVEVSINPYISVQEGTTVDIPPGHEKLDVHVPASFVATPRELSGCDGLLLLTVQSSNPARKAVSTWKINWGDGVIQTVSYLSNSMKFSHWYSESGSYNISIYIGYADGTGESTWCYIANWDVSLPTSSAAEEPSPRSTGLAAVVDSVLETEDMATLTRSDIVDENDLMILGSVTLPNTPRMSTTYSARSVYFSRLRLDSFFDGNLNLKKKRILL